jgi:branched-subunit amino acid transport protein
LWSAFQRDVRELPPAPLSFLTVSGLAFMTAGVVAGLLTLLPVRRWVKVIASPVVAGIGAGVICGLTRSAGLFPIGSGGWDLITDPLFSGVLAAPAAFMLAFAVEVLYPSR